MATKTRAEMITRVLQKLSVLAAGQTAKAEDAAVVGSALDGVHTRWRREGLAPFASSAWPAWAQEPYALVIGNEVASDFGKVVPADKLDAAKKQIIDYMRGKRHPRHIELKWF